MAPTRRRTRSSAPERTLISTSPVAGLMGDALDVPPPDHGFEPVVVLIRPHHPGNVGAVARVMANMGLSELILVDPEADHLSDEAVCRAKWAGHVLRSARVVGDWTSAAEDLGVVIGTSGKREVGRKSLVRNFSQPWEIGERWSGTGTRVGLVFGPEGLGLVNEELLRCDLLVSIPTWEGYPVLNLSHAVTILLWEVHRHLVSRSWGMVAALPRTMEMERVLDAGGRRALRAAIEHMVEALPGDETRREHIADCLTRVVFRGAPSQAEAHRVIGALVDATAALRYVGEDARWRRERLRRLVLDEEA